MKIPLTFGYDSEARKNLPVLAVAFGYFAAAMAGLTRHAVRSNEKHNPGEPLHWARGKSMDHAECTLRHLVDAAEIRAWLRRNPNHPERESVITMLEHEHDARVWRANADSQEFYEEFRGAPLSFSSRLPETPARIVGKVPELAAGYGPPALDYAHELTPEAGRRLTYPPLGTPADYSAVWKVARPGDRWAYYANPDSPAEESRLPRDHELTNPFPTEAEARAAYWRWKDGAAA